MNLRGSECAGRRTEVRAAGALRFIVTLSVERTDGGSTDRGTAQRNADKDGRRWLPSIRHSSGYAVVSLLLFNLVPLIGAFLDRDILPVIFVYWFENGVIISMGNLFDLNDDLTLNQIDIDEWLSNAATFNGYAVPYRRGDFDGLGKVSPALLAVDIRDYRQLHNNYDDS